MKTHLSINVSSVENSIDFYKKMFGVEPVKVRAGYAKFDIANPPLNFTMNERAVEKGGSLSHLGLQVESTEEVLAMGKRWQESGLITLDEMKTDCCYALQDKTWARDPDGNEWEVFVVLENTEPTADACACGDKVEHSELSTAACCTPGQKASTIGQSSEPCCL